MNNDTKTYGTTGTDANRDPLTGAPGSHPVGTATGAVAGGAAGAAVGSAAGPVGTVVGAAVGAVVGAGVLLVPPQAATRIAAPAIRPASFRIKAPPSCVWGPGLLLPGSSIAAYRAGIARWGV